MVVYCFFNGQIYNLYEDFNNNDRLKSQGINFFVYQSISCCIITSILCLCKILYNLFTIFNLSFWLMMLFHFYFLFWLLKPCDESMPTANEKTIPLPKKYPIPKELRQYQYKEYEILFEEDEEDEKNVSSIQPSKGSCFLKNNFGKKKRNKLHLFKHSPSIIFIFLLFWSFSRE